MLQSDQTLQCLGQTRSGKMLCHMRPPACLQHRPHRVHPPAGFSTPAPGRLGAVAPQSRLPSLQDWQPEEGSSSVLLAEWHSQRNQEELGLTPSDVSAARLWREHGWCVPVHLGHSCILKALLRTSAGHTWTSEHLGHPLHCARPTVSLSNACSRDGIVRGHLPPCLEMRGQCHVAGCLAAVQCRVPLRSQRRVAVGQLGVLCTQQCVQQYPKGMHMQTRPGDALICLAPAGRLGCCAAQQRGQPEPPVCVRSLTAHTSQVSWERSSKHSAASDAYQQLARSGSRRSSANLPASWSSG